MPGTAKPTSPFSSPPREGGDHGRGVPAPSARTEAGAHARPHAAARLWLLRAQTQKFAMPEKKILPAFSLQCREIGDGTGGHDCPSPGVNSACSGAVWRAVRASTRHGVRLAECANAPRARACEAQRFKMAKFVYRPFSRVKNKIRTSRGGAALADRNAHARVVWRRTAL